MYSSPTSHLQQSPSPLSVNSEFLDFIFTHSAIMSNTADKASEQPQQQKPQILEEDDEFEDFPVEGTSLVISSII